MALTRLARLFPEVVHSPVTQVEDEPGWLYAQSCETWWKGSEHLAPVTVLLVYRSALVDDTCRLYRPVSDLICGANKLEIIGKGTQFDPNMMGESGEFLFARMTQEDQFAEGPLDMSEVRSICADRVGSLLTGRMASV
ncbi:hypothetical protein SEA_TARSUSIV_72 [Mycobacterium phage TarsusIV]|nr:hypothetical protein SEA_TARSUSIV_72 [Mycobacterium phage TarsusIV]